MLHMLYVLGTKWQISCTCKRLSLKWGTGNRGTGNRRMGMGNGESENGNGERGTGNGERGTGNL